MSTYKNLSSSNKSSDKSSDRSSNKSSNKNLSSNRNSSSDKSSNRNSSLNRNLSSNLNRDKITVIQDAFLQWLIDEEQNNNRSKIKNNKPTQLNNRSSKIYKLEFLTAKDLLKIKVSDYLEGLGFIKQSYVEYLHKYRRAIIKELRKSLNLEKLKSELKEELKEELKGELNNEDIKSNIKTNIETNIETNNKTNNEDIETKLQV